MSIQRNNLPHSHHATTYGVQLFVEHAEGGLVEDGKIYVGGLTHGLRRNCCENVTCDQRVQIWKLGT